MKNSYKRPLLWMLGYLSVIIAFAWIYYLLPQECWGSKDMVNSCIDALYFSVVTITSLGFGDIYPGAGSATRILVCSESLLGIFIIGFFLNDVAMSQAKALNRKEREKDEKQKRDSAIRKIRLWQSELEPVITIYLAVAYEVITPEDKRNYPENYLTHGFRFNFCDMYNLYGHSHFMANDFYEPVIAIYFRNEDKLYEALYSFVSNADLNYWPELEKEVYHLMRLHHGFHFKDAIMKNHNNLFKGDSSLKDMLINMIKETEGEPQYKDSNLFNSYVDLYFTLKDSIGTIQKIYSMMSDIGDNEDEGQEHNNE